MASYDNEIYRGPPEAGPTLERDIRSYGSDVYIVKSEVSTLKQDVPPTEEPVRQESKPVQKKESKIAKAMKLLASCTAAVTIATNIAAATTLDPVIPDNDLPEWPRFSQIDANLNGHALSTPSRHGNMVQVSTGSRTFRITTKQEGLHLFWNNTYNIDYDSNREAFCLLMENFDEDWFLDVSFHLYPQTDTWNENELFGQFITPSGETFYLRAYLPDGEESTKERTADIMARLSDYIEFSEATDDGWGKVLIGETMISDTSAQWNGILTTPEVSTDFCFSRINYKQYAEYSEDQFIRSLTINDIDWSFYYSFDEYSLLLWAVPAQEDIALCAGLDFIVNEMGLPISELAAGSAEIDAVLMDHLGIAVELAAKYCFSNYHLYDNPNWTPPDSPGSPTEPPTLPAPDTGIEDFVYWSGTDFHFAGRSFIMEAMREDAMFREVYKGEDNIQFDVRVDYDNIRILVIISDAPNGAEYYPYVLDNGRELYIAAFNYWDNAQLLDEATLHDLARDFASYFSITENTEPGETVPAPMDDPHSHLPEYTQYLVTSSGMSYSPLARSNRVCHFSTNDGNYCLEAQTPDMFMLWENYYYDMKEESANSYITLQNIAESWSMGVWVFDEQVESVYDCFTLTTEDGTTLWFYIANFDDYTQQNRLEAVLSQLPDLVRLSHAKEGNWTKVLYGQSLIVDVTSSWSGLAYTASNDDFWYFDQMISVNDLQYYNLRFADSRTVNGTTWEFYTTGGSNGYGMTAGKEFYSTQVFVVPSGGDICFVTSLYNGLSVDQYEFSNQAEYEAYIDTNIHPAIDTIVSQGLINFHSYQSPDNVPTDPTNPSLTGDYFTGLDFSFEGRSFRMDALRNDVSFRQLDQFDDSVVFDFRADDENLRVLLIISSTPLEVEYPYYLTNGTEIYVSAFNYWGDPWTADEQTLAALAQNLSAYVYIDETTDPYSYLPEFRQYRFERAGLTYDLYARSNRICQFVIDQTAYRLESQIPEILIVCDDYSCRDFMNQFAGYSSIEIYNPAEGWHFNLKVYDKPIESLDYGFSLTTEDGSELWFYHVTVHGPEGIEHQPEISWMANLVKLTTPQDDGWGRFRFGETVIVNQTPYWSGTRYITGGENGWQFHMGPSTDITEYAMSFAGSRVVNGVQWNFYTYCGFLREGSGKEIDGVYHPTKIYLTRIFAVPEQEDICLYVELEQNYNYEDGILALPEYAFFSRAEYDACLDANIGSIIDTIVSQGLSNFYPYSE